MKMRTLAVRMIKKMARMITAKLSNKVQVKYSKLKIMMIQFAAMTTFSIVHSSQIVKRFAIQKTT